MMQLEERTELQIAGDPTAYGVFKRACANVVMGAVAPPNSYLVDEGNRTLTIATINPYDSATSISGAPCTSFEARTRGSSLNFIQTDTTPLEFLNRFTPCPACLESGAFVPVASCDIAECNIPFALPLYTQIPYVGPCARYTPHPVLPGYNMSCAMTTQANCVSTGTPGELYQWLNENANVKCRSIASSLSDIEYNTQKRAVLPRCPGNHVMMRRNDSGEIDYWCLHKDAAWTGYTGSAVYSFHVTGGSFADCNLTNSFTQTTNIGSLVSYFNTGVNSGCFIERTINVAGYAFFSPSVTAL